MNATDSRPTAIRRSSGSEPDTSLSQFVTRFTKNVYRFLRGMLGDDEMAADLTQETFLRIARAHGQSRVDRAATPLTAPYLFTVARHTAISYLRRASLEHEHVEVLPPEEMERFDAGSRAGLRSTASDPEAEAERSELREALRRALQSIPEAPRAVFLLSEVEGLSYAEIGVILDCAVGTVASRKHHAIRSLRRELRRQGFEL